ncbi:LysR family transcriptional regulator [Peribacillus simplex]
MDFRELRYFLIVTREISITGAADFLHVTQTTLSKTIKRT